MYWCPFVHIANRVKGLSAFGVELRRADFFPSPERVEASSGCSWAVGRGSAFGEVIKDLAIYSGGLFAVRAFD